MEPIPNEAYYHNVSYLYEDRTPTVRGFFFPQPAIPRTIYELTRTYTTNNTLYVRDR